MSNLYEQLMRPDQSLQPQSQTPQKLQSSKNNSLLKNLMNSSDPHSFIQNMVANNPQLKNVMQLFQSSGMSPKQFFYQYAQQQGVNPDQFLNSLK